MWISMLVFYNHNCSPGMKYLNYLLKQRHCKCRWKNGLWQTKLQLITSNGFNQHEALSLYHIYFMTVVARWSSYQKKYYNSFFWCLDSEFKQLLLTWIEFLKSGLSPPFISFRNGSLWFSLKWTGPKIQHSSIYPDALNIGKIKKYSFSTFQNDILKVG